MCYTQSQRLLHMCGFVKIIIIKLKGIRSVTATTTTTDNNNINTATQQRIFTNTTTTIRDTVIRW